MARSGRSLLVALAAVCVLSGLRPSFVAPPSAVQHSQQQQLQAAVLSAALAVAPSPVFAARVEEEDEGFDLRILAVLALPLFATRSIFI